MKQRKLLLILFLISIIGLQVSCKKKDTDKNNPLLISNLAVLTTTLPNDQFMSLTFINNTVGYAVSNHGLIIKTTDEGKTWQTIANLGNDMLLTKIQFTDSQNGYVIAGDSNGGYLYKTTDAGNTWTKKEFNPVQAGVPNDLFFLNPAIGFVTGPGLFIKTTDGGNTWNNVLANSQYNFNNINFQSSTKGFVTCNKGVYLTTTDAGITWQLTTLNPDLTLTDIYFANNNVFFNAYSGLLNISDPSQLITLPSGATKLLFIDEKKCVAAGQHYEGGFWPYGDFFITNDLWKTNEKKTFQPSQAYSFKCIARVSTNKIMAIGYGTSAFVVIISW